MIRYWAMRFEAKHSYFKDMAQRSKCFKNIAKSLAHRHQNLVSYHLSKSQSLIKDLLIGKGKLSGNELTLKCHSITMKFIQLF